MSDDLAIHELGRTLASAGVDQWRRRLSELDATEGVVGPAAWIMACLGGHAHGDEGTATPADDVPLNREAWELGNRVITSWHIPEHLQDGVYPSDDVLWIISDAVGSDGGTGRITTALFPQEY